MIYSAKRMNLSFCLPGRKKNPDNPVNPVKKKPLTFLPQAKHPDHPVDPVRKLQHYL